MALHAQLAQLRSQLQQHGLLLQGLKVMFDSALTQQLLLLGWLSCVFKQVDAVATACWLPQLMLGSVAAVLLLMLMVQKILPAGVSAAGLPPLLRVSCGCQQGNNAENSFSEPRYRYND